MLVNKTTLDENTNLTRTREEKFLENEARLSERLFAEQNIFDEKIVNNMLKLNILFYIFTLSLIGLVVFYGKDIFGFYNEKVELTFSIYQFTQVTKADKFTNVSNKYSCVRNSTNCDNDCHDISLSSLREIFPFECTWFSQFLLAGLIVIYFNKK
jgi:hypothetical protein